MSKPEQPYAIIADNNVCYARVEKEMASLLVLLLLEKVDFVRKMGFFYLGNSSFTLWHVQAVIISKSSGIYFF